MKRLTWALQILSLVALLFSLVQADQITQAQTNTQPPAAFCADVRYLMAREITPYDLNFGGGFLSPNTRQESTLPAGTLGDTWSFNITAPATGRSNPTELRLTFPRITDLRLEMGLFRGMDPVPLPTNEASDEVYQPVEAQTAYTYSLDTTGVYTLVVRRISVTDVEQPGGYTLQADFIGDNAVTRSQPLRDDSLGRVVAEAAVFNSGREVISLPAREVTPAQVTLHPGAAYLVASYQGAHRQVYYGIPGNNHYLYLNDWADKIDLVGGDLAVSGFVDAGNATDAGRQRIFYLENFGYQFNNGQGGDLLELNDALNVDLLLSWDTLQGVWITRECAGFKVYDPESDSSRTFIGQLDPTTRQITFRGTADDFTIALPAPDRAGISRPHEMTLSFEGISMNAEMQLYNGIFNVTVADQRQISLEATALDLRQDAAVYTVTLPAQQQGDAADAVLRFDWQTLTRFALLENRLELSFQDAPRSFTQRIVNDLLRFEELEQVIQIIEKPDAQGSPGEERLLLPGSESFIEIITPAGQPQFDGRALPGQPGYFPRGLNNTGGECYPVNTLLPQANCPPNGHPNPANGSLWYAITDHLARGSGPYGGPFDLALTRSYNSAYAAVDGPFGLGWTSVYRLDYDVPYDTTANTRVIDAAQAERYPVGLNLTWAPRGVVTLTTPSGSRHVFVRSDPAATTGTFASPTMPGWSLERADVRAPWILRQSDGLTMTFDRAGRIVRFGYPTLKRIITIDYPRDTLNGAGALGEGTPILITDQADQRRLELYYDQQHHIIRSRLRDMTLSTAAEITACDAAQRCFETQYTYDEAGRLIGVQYADGSQATYTYDEAHRLRSHDDPRAPVAQRMTYEYDSNGLIRSISVFDPATETSVPWRTLVISIPPDTDNSGDPTQRVVSVTDALGNTRTYTYALEDSDLRTVGSTFTLLSETSPLAELGGFEAVPEQYEWTDGLLTLVGSRQVVTAAGQGGRNSTAFRYAGDTLVDIRGGLPTLTITTDPSGLLETITTPDDNTTRQSFYEQDPINGERILARFVDQFGAEYRFEWLRDADGAVLWPRVITRSNDQIVTAYTYNNLGLVTQLQRYRAGDDLASAYLAEYTYDGLGRLIGVQDAQTGGYTIAYPPSRDGISTITLTDATQAITVNRFDARGHLLEACLAEAAAMCGSDDAVGYYRRTTYTYDLYGRLLTESRWQSPVAALADLAEESPPTPLTTSYSYTPVRELPPLEANEAPTLMGGYTIAVSHPPPFPRTQRYTYDALDRIRQVEDEFRRIIRFDYSVENVQIDTATPNANGLRITSRELVGSTLIRAEYIFDSQWQLLFVERQTPDDGDDARDELQRWRLRPQSEVDRSLALTEADGARINEQRWGPYRQGRPVSVQTVQINLRLNGAVELPVPSLEAEVDFLGRPLNARDGGGTAYAVRYCPVAGGGERILYGVLSASAPPAEAFTCTSTPAALALTYDAAGRLIRVETPSGTHDYVYTADAAAQQWQVDVTLTDRDINRWQFTYNPAGDLLAWHDDNGITRTYIHDSLGRMRRIETVEDDQPNPEASFTFVYNEADLMINRLDDLGRGQRYVYNERAQTTVEQDARTGNATIYGYNAIGLLSTVISPLGNTTTYLYEDPHDPFRLTGIIGPGGNLTEFTWDDATNSLTYDNQRDVSTRYTFDSFGVLWRIDDALGTPLARSHELHYDAGGQLIAWRQTQPAQGDPERFLALAYNQPGVVTLSDAADTATRAGSTGWSRTFTTSPAGQLLQIDTPGSQPLTLTYDALGRFAGATAGEQTWTLNYIDGEPRITLTEAFGAQISYSYDALGRLLREGDLTDPAAPPLNTYAYVYDSGADVTIRAQRDGTRLYVFSPGDSASRQASVRLRAPGNRVTYTYDANGLLIEIVNEACVSFAPVEAVDAANPDACGEGDSLRRTAERFTYDAQGRPLRYINQEENIATFAYDDTGNLITFQNVAGQTFNYSYDALNRLTAIDGPTGVRLLLRYNPLDQVDGICRAREETALTYEACQERGGVLEEYTYDALGRLLGQDFASSSATAADSPAYTYSYTESGQLSAWGGVTLEYDPALGLLADLQVTATAQSASRYTLTYAALNRLAAIDSERPERYTYTTLGRASAVSLGSQTFGYTYAPQGQGYVISDAASANGIRTQLDARGYLREIAALNTTSPADVLLNYAQTANGRSLVVEANWAGGEVEVVELQLNRRLEGLSAVYERSNLFIDYVTDAVGEVQRLGIAGLQSYFIPPNSGYIILVGYDDDGRPLTLRVNDRASGRLIYLLSFTYDNLGQRITETRQYGDAEQSQVLISTNYTNVNELSTRQITLTQRSLGEQSAPLLLLLPLVGWWMGSRTRPAARRWALLGSLLLLMVSTWTFTRSSAQQQVQTYNYNYDSVGNLVSVSRSDPQDASAALDVCVRYTYDGANRLIGLERGDFSQTYRYDLRNRLIGIDDRDLYYIGDSPALLGVRHGGTASDITYYGQTADLPGFFQTDADGVTWLFNDGRTQIIAARAGDSDTPTSPLWLFDPIGRYLSLDINLANDDPCEQSAIPPELTALSPLQILRDDLVWEATTNLYFIDGRVYSPQVGRFLQRDPLGPDAFGNVYSYPSRQTTPPIHPLQPPYQVGLQQFGSALNTIAAANAHTSTAIRQQYYPRLNPAIAETLLPLLDQTAQYTRDRLARQLDLPVWLAGDYDQFAAYFDDAGRLRTAAGAARYAPGQGGRPGSTPAYIGDIFAPDVRVGATILPPLQRLHRVVEISADTPGYFTNYETFGWRPLPVMLNDTWSLHPPRLGLEQTPYAVWEWLPQPLLTPQTAAAALDAVEAMIAAATTTHEAWLAHTLRLALPQPPTLPPVNGDAWLGTYFTDDTLGIARTLAERWPQPPALDVPVYGLGLSEEWARLR